MPAGRVTVAGIAWAQHTGIDRVEVRVDGGPWQPAELSTEVNPDSGGCGGSTSRWPPGDHTVQSRATDRTGGTQTEARADVIPDGATGWPEVAFTAS